MKYLWRAAMCGLMSVSFGAQGVVPSQAPVSPLQVLDMTIAADAAWQRGTPAQELEDDALLLSLPLPSPLSLPRQGGPALQVVIPRTPALIKSDEPVFYRNVTRKWAMLYGKNAAIGWISVDQHGNPVLEKYAPDGAVPDATGTGDRTHARRWLSCRRPARSGDGVVFHMVTTYQGRAYSVLLFAPQDTTALPQAAVDLLAKTVLAKAALEKTEFSPEKVEQAGGQAAVQASTRADLAPSAASTVTSTPTSTVAPVLMPWVKTQTVRLSPQGEALEALVQIEADSLGNAGMVTGYGVASKLVNDEDELSWFLEGFRWSAKPGRAEREPFDLRGSVVARAPEQLVTGQHAPLATLRLQAEVAPSPVMLQVQIHDYCGPLADWKMGMDALKRGARGTLERAQRSHACAQSETMKVMLEMGGAGENNAGAKEVALTSTLNPTLNPAPSANRRWIEVRLMSAPGVGNALLDRLGMIWIYEPGVPAD